MSAALPSRPPKGARVRVIAVGKAALAMLDGALARWGEHIDECLVVLPDEPTNRRAETRSRGRIEIMRAGHPLPDARSVRAADRCLAFASAGSACVVLVLVSGGASALLCAPSAGVSLRDKRAVTRALIESAATIQEINVVRKHLSRIKGGGLARAAFPSGVVTLVASDVIGGGAADVGSGPTVADSSRVGEARAILARFAPAFVGLPLTPARRNAPLSRACVIATPEMLAREVAGQLRAGGHRVRVLPSSQASVEELARDYVALAQRSSCGHAFVRAAEPSVKVPARAGRGGRSTHLAALVGRDVPRGAAFLAAATDGVDGGSGTAGAVVDASFASRVARRLGARALDDAIARFDTATLHRAARTALAGRPSGHNLADVHVLVVGDSVTPGASGPTRVRRGPSSA